MCRHRHLLGLVPERQLHSGNASSSHRMTVNAAHTVGELLRDRRPQHTGGVNAESAAAGAIIGAFREEKRHRAQLIRAVCGGLGSEKERYANRGTALILPIVPCGDTIRATLTV